MKSFQIVRDGTVENVAAFPAGAVLDGNGVTWEDGAWMPASGAKVFDVEGAQIGWTVKGNTLVPPEVVLPDLDKAAVLASIDAAAENARLKYITPGAGQALTYQEKAAELARYDEDTQPRLAEYPLLAAEIGITADSLKGVADAVRAALSAWRQAGAAIERVRLQAKADVEKARNDDAIRAILDAIEWP